MKFLKLKCNGNLRVAEEIAVSIPGTTKEIKLWIVAGEGVEVKYGPNGTEVEVGNEGMKLGIYVHAKYRTITCNGGQNDVVWGVEDIEEL